MAGQHEEVAAQFAAMAPALEAPVVTGIQGMSLRNHDDGTVSNYIRLGTGKGDFFFRLDLETTEVVLTVLGTIQESGRELEKATKG